MRTLKQLFRPITVLLLLAALFALAGIMSGPPAAAPATAPVSVPEVTIIRPPVVSRTMDTPRPVETPAPLSEEDALCAYIASLDKPAEWAEAIIRYAAADGVSPWAIAAVITTESRWDATASGSSGEVGLMQILPATARALAAEVGLTGADPADPLTNIRLGAHYLAGLYREHHDPVATLAAYNGGPRWSDKPAAIRYADKVMGLKISLERQWIGGGDVR